MSDAFARIASELHEADDVSIELTPITAWCLLDLLQGEIRRCQNQPETPRLKLLKLVALELQIELPENARRLADRHWHPEWDRPLPPDPNSPGAA